MRQRLTRITPYLIITGIDVTVSRLSIVTPGYALWKQTFSHTTLDWP